METQSILQGSGREETAVLKPLQNRRRMEEFCSFCEVPEAKTRTKLFEKTNPAQFQAQRPVSQSAQNGT